MPPGGVRLTGVRHCLASRRRVPGQVGRRLSERLHGLSSNDFICLVGRGGGAGTQAAGMGVRSGASDCSGEALMGMPGTRTCGGLHGNNLRRNPSVLNVGVLPTQ